MNQPNFDVNLLDRTEKIQDFMDWIKFICHAPTILSIDTETTGLEWWSYRFTRLVQFGTPEGGWAVPVDWFGRVIHDAMSHLVAADKDVVMHNSKFDMHALEAEGYPVPHWAHVHDTAILLRLRRSDMSAALKGKQTAELLGKWIYKGQGWLGARTKELGLRGEGKWRYIPVDEEAYWAYGIFDTCLTAMLFKHADVRQHVDTPQYLREMHYQAIMYRCESRGLRINENWTRNMQDQYQQQIDTELHFLQSQGLKNPNSNDQVAELFETDYAWVPEVFTPSGEPALNKDVLATLAAAGGMQTDVVESLIRYKRAIKWKGTYIDRFLTQQDRHGFIHPSINTMGARTGRTTVQLPAVQTLPSRDFVIRKCIQPPVGHEWYSVDYSNQEPRALAHYGASDRLRRFFLEGEGSVHDFVAGNLFGEGYDKGQRDIAKAFGLGRSYGAGISKLAEASGLPEAQVERQLPEYDKLMGLTALNAGIEQAQLDRDPMYVVTKGGRRVYADDEKMYTLTNYLMQGSGADMLKDAAIRLDMAGFSDYILLPVHDELTFGLPKGEEGKEMAQEIARLMEDDSYSVPMPVDIEGPGDSWGALYEEKEA